MIRLHFSFAAIGNAIGHTLPWLFVGAITYLLYTACMYLLFADKLLFVIMKLLEAQVVT